MRQIFSSELGSDYTEVRATGRAVDMESFRPFITLSHIPSELYIPSQHGVNVVKYHNEFQSYNLIFVIQFYNSFFYLRDTRN
jgi:hypothetical protein